MDSTTFYFQHESDRLFYAAVYFSDYKHEWQPIERGNMVALEFDIIWWPSPAPVVSSISLPDFLMSQDSAVKALSAWSTLVKQKILEKSVGSSIGVSDDILLILLEEQYHETYFNFSALKGKDRKIAHILQSIDFIDVHLAVTYKMFEENEENGISSNICSHESSHAPSLSYQIVQWIYSGISLPQFWNYKLDLKTQFIKTSSNTSGSLDQSRHLMLVIQPRWQSVLRCCDVQFDVMLSHLESRLLSEHYSTTLRKHLAACLGQVLDYCQLEPSKVWGIPAAKAAERTRRLMQICRDLPAPKEIHILLAILGKNFSRDTNGHPPIVIYEGVRNELVARLTIDMVLDAGGNIVIIMIISTPLFQDLKFCTCIRVA